MGKTDKAQSSKEILTAAMGTHDAVADATPIVLQQGGKYVKVPVSVASGDTAIVWTDAYGRLTANISAHQIAIGNGTLGAGTTTSTAIVGMNVYKDLDLDVVSTGVSGTTPTLNIFVDSKLDGTNLVNLSHLTEITTNTRVGIHLTRRNANGEVGSFGSDAGAGTLRAIGWGDDIRIRAVVAGTNPNFVVTVYLNAVG